MLKWFCLFHQCDNVQRVVILASPSLLVDSLVRDVLFEFHLKLWNSASIGIPIKVDRLLNGLSAQQKRTTARWYSNKTSLS